MPERIRSIVGIALLAVASAAAAFSLANGVAPTSAAWTDDEYAKAATTAVTPAPPTALVCGVPASGGFGSSIPFTWTAPAGTPPSGYTLKWTGGAVGSASFTTTNGTVPSSGVLLGSLTVSVYADYGSWQSLAGTQVRHVTSILFGTLWSCGA